MILTVLIVLGVIAALVAVVEFGHRTLPLPAELARKSIHMGAAMIGAAAPLFLGKMELIAIALLTAVLLLALRKSGALTALHAIERTTYGDAFLPLGIGISAFLFLPGNLPAFQFGALVLGFADAAASLVGEYLRFRPFALFGNKKSIGGSAAFFLVALLLAHLFISAPFLMLALIACALTIAEAASGYGLDNLFLPTLASALMLLALV